MVPIYAEWTLLLRHFGLVHFWFKECLVILALSCFIESSVFSANSVDPDQKPRSVVSDLDLYCLPTSLLLDAGYIWVNALVGVCLMLLTRVYKHLTFNKIT